MVLPDGNGARSGIYALASDHADLPLGQHTDGFLNGVATAFTGVGVHALAMIAMTAIIATLVYEWLGLAPLQRVWLNMDLIWLVALLATGTLLLLT
jgi:hypothetical protein